MTPTDSSTFVPRAAMDLYLETFPSAAIQTYGGGDYISPSQVKMFARCPLPEQFRQRYILGRKERPGAALVWGSADHDAHEVNFAQKLTSRKDMTIDDIKTVFATKLDEGVERNGGVGEIEWKHGEVLTGDDAVKAAADVKDCGVRLVECYHKLVSPSVIPTAVEEKFVVPGDQLGIPVNLEGRIDLRALVPASSTGEFRPGATDVERVEKIIDRKTSAQKKKINANPEWVTQGRLYQLGDHVLNGVVRPVEWHLALKPGPRRKLPDVVANDPTMVLEPQPIAMVKQQLRLTVAGISFMYATYGPDEPWPGAWAGFASSCDYCGFRDAGAGCAWWHGDRWKDAA